MGSSITYAVLSSLNPKEEEVQVPNEKIINYELNAQQRALLLQKYFTLVEYRYYNGCLECADAKNNLEYLTQNSEDQIYLQEITSDTSSVSVSIMSLRGQKTLNNPTKEEIQTNICSLIVNRPLWCVTTKI
jgi:hypothetical protein